MVIAIGGHRRKSWATRGLLKPFNPASEAAKMITSSMAVPILQQRLGDTGLLPGAFLECMLIWVTDISAMATVIVLGGLMFKLAGEFARSTCC
jgi:hypothetical protein